MVAADLRLLPVEPANFHRAAELVLHVPGGLRAGDALHLACAETAGAKHVATLDDVLIRNAQRLKIKPVVLRDPPCRRSMGSQGRSSGEVALRSSVVGDHSQEAAFFGRVRLHGS